MLFKELGTKLVIYVNEDISRLFGVELDDAIVLSPGGVIENNTASLLCLFGINLRQTSTVFHFKSFV